MTALKKKSETCEEQLRRMCRNIADDITNPVMRKDEETGEKREETAHDWMEDVYDIEWITFQDGTFKGARVLVAGGGPTIWVNVKTDEVEGYWAGDHCTEPFQDNLGLRAYLEELHASSK
jgi:hypothetical protein|tara:strand:+ start:182 stop:541 length:360 start_codon:yes stop_codon:yes gene_type:complete